MVGITQNRSVQDEKLIEAVFQSHHSPESRASASQVYGATTTNLIIDARPTANAMANTAKGAGSENMDHYKEGKKAYLGIDHIHTMRESLGKVVEALRDADTLLASINNDLPDHVAGITVLDRQALRRSGWLRHISAILEGTVLITRNVHVNSSHVLIHCSDGWDRTSQLSALTQLCLDPFYRTIRGFEILIEKDWLSYGHKFLDRCGHLSSDKFFLSPNETAGTGSGADAAQAFLASVQNRFVSQQHLKETSPVFHQFLEAVRQVQRQFPERFEFNERFLHQLYYHLYSCQFGTFLYNCERDRRVADGGPPPCDRTVSVWDFFNSPSEMAQNVNSTFDPSLDDPASRAVGADMGVLFPNPKDVRFWHELYGRTDEEMNGRPFVTQARGVEIVGPIESAEDDVVFQRAQTPSTIPLPPSPAKSPPVTLLPSRSLSLKPGSPGPSMGDNIRELSTSMTDAGVKLPPTRADSIPFSTSPSGASPMRPPRVPSPNTQFSPNRARTKPPDFLSSSGVKSVWGKLSSNASAALSVVQDAYVGVAKDLRSTGVNEGESSAKTAELRGRDTLTAWGEETSSVSRGLESLSVGTTNPWATSRPHPALDDNPWGSVRSPVGGPLGHSYQPSSPLPVDPTVAHPLPRVASSLSSVNAPPTPPLARNDEPPKAANTSGTDPLGVGLF